MRDQDLLPTFLRTTAAAKAMGMSKMSIYKLMDDGKLAGYEAYGHYVERRSIVRWLIGRGLCHEALPSSIVCDVVTIGLHESLTEGLKRLLPQEDFRVSQHPTSRLPRVAILDLSDDPEIPDVELAIGIAPADGVRDRWKQGCDTILTAPVSSRQIVDLLRKMVS